MNNQGTRIVYLNVFIQLVFEKFAKNYSEIEYNRV